MSDIKLTFDASKFRKRLHLLEEMSLDARMAAAEQIGDVMVGRAKNNAPVDEGSLTQDITHTVENKDSTIVVYCYVPANAPSASYAIKIHEDTYNLGPNSLAKAAKGFSVGNKYIRRAMDDSVEDIGNIIEFEYKRRLK